MTDRSPVPRRLVWRLIAAGVAVLLSVTIASGEVELTRDPDGTSSWSQASPWR